jgi:hypothetical protein
MKARYPARFRQQRTIAPSQSLRRRSNRFVWACFCAFTVLSLLAWVYQQYDFDDSARIGLAIPDVVNMSETFDNLIATGAFDTDENQFVGVTILYGWTWFSHPALCLVVNMLLMYAATKVYSGYFIKRLGAPSWTILGVLGNPYLLLAMVGPNKEVPLLLLTLLYFSAITERRPGGVLLAAVICIAIYTFRDVYGAFLGFFLLVLAVTRLDARWLAVITLLGCLSVAALFGAIAPMFPVFERAIQSFEAIEGGSLAVGNFATLVGADPFSVLGGAFMFLLRVIYNLLTAAFFPVFFTTEGIHLLGVAYWAFGLMLLASISSCMLYLSGSQSNKQTMLIAAALSVSVLFMVSVSLFVQPRYLMPVLPLAIGVLSCCSKRAQSNLIIAVVVLSLSVILVYWLMGRAPMPSGQARFDTPAYVLQD